MERLLAWTVLLAIVGTCDSAERLASPSEPTDPAQTMTRQLDATHPTIEQPVTAANAAQAKFVEVHIEHVQNPALAALSFAVAYKTSVKELSLGSFSLYPPDHPGTFIVPTQGKLGLGGSILLTLENPDHDARVQVSVGQIRLIWQPSSVADADGEAK